MTKFFEWLQKPDETETPTEVYTPAESASIHADAIKQAYLQAMDEAMEVVYSWEQRALRKVSRPMHQQFRNIVADLRSALVNKKAAKK